MMPTVPPSGKGLRNDRNVTTTNFVPRTFHQIETARPSLLVVDLCHGEKAGWELLTELRQEASTQQIPVILVSTSKHYLERAKEEHALWGGDWLPWMTIKLTKAM